MKRLTTPSSPSRHWQVLAVTAVAVFMTFLDVTVVNIALPSLRSEFQSSSLSLLSWVINGYGVAFAAALVPAGRLADAIGRRRVFVAGVAIFVLASAWCGLAWSPSVLITARVLQAIGAAAVVPTSLALLVAAFPPARRAAAIGLWGATGALAAAVGPSLGGALVTSLGWRSVFFLNVPVGLVAIASSRRVLTEARDPASSRSDWPGAGLLALGIGAIALAIVQTSEWGWVSARTVGAGAAGVALLGLLAMRCARHPDPIIEPALVRIRSFTWANTGTAIFAVGFYGLLLCNVLFLTGVWRLPLGVTGLALTPGALTAAVAAPLGGRIADRRGQWAVAVAGGLSFAAGATFLALASQPTVAYAVRFLPGIVLTGAGIGLSVSSLGSAAVSGLPPGRLATGSALNACARQVGAVLGVAVLVAILSSSSTGDALGGFRTAWTVMGCAGLGAALCGLALRRARTPENRTTVPNQEVMT